MLNSIASPSIENSPEFLTRLWEESWTYIKTVVDTVREPFLILDENLCVMVANDSFYQTFKVSREDTEHKHVYELGNGQWNSKDLRRLLEDILPKDTFFKGFEVVHEFPIVGRKVMILNARRLYNSGSDSTFPAIILLAMEDVTELLHIAEKFDERKCALENDMLTRTRALEIRIEQMEKELAELRFRS